MSRVATRLAVPRPAAVRVAPPPAPPARVLAEAEHEADRAAESVVTAEPLPAASLSRLPSAPAGHPAAPPPPPPPGGQPLPSDRRAGLQRQLGHDFGSVRVHSGSAAEAAARALHARAFTFGEHVVLGAGLPGLHTPAGTRMLAHELAHVVQQRQRRPRVQRLGFWDSIGVFFGVSEGDFSKRELLDYLAMVSSSRRIEGSWDSDNKARAIARRYKTGDKEFDLSAPQKIVLIEEMLDGPTLIEDETLIVTLLELSDDPDLEEIVFFGGLTPDRLESDITNTEPRARLDMLFTNRFEGGRPAVMAGDIQAMKMPRKDFDSVQVVKDLASDRPVAEIVEELLVLPPVVRERATRFLGNHRVELHRQVQETKDKTSGAADKAEKDELQKAVNALEAERLRVDIVLANLYRDAAGGETTHTLRETTVARDPVEPEVAKKDLAPEPAPSTIDESTGKPVLFSDLPAEKKQQYRTDLSAKLEEVLTTLWNNKAKEKGEKEHADPAKTHQLSEMERIGERAKMETDKVFGQFALGPPLKGDQPGKPGNIHDQWAVIQTRLEGMNAGQKRTYAKDKVFYEFANDEQLLQISRGVNASPDFGASNEEAVIQRELADEATDTEAKVKRINEIQRGWGGTARSGHINMQLFKAETEVGQQAFLWRSFQTLIHEYLHTLAHSNYVSYANSFGYGTTPYTTLIEGIDCVLAETVWAVILPRVTADLPLREAVVGPDLAAKEEKGELKPLVPGHPARYPSFAEAVKLYSQVGAANVYAAYFLGDVKKIKG